MINNETWVLAAGGSGVGLITLLAIPSICNLAKQRFLSARSEYRLLDNDDETTNVKSLYEDADGKASEESEAAYSAKVQMTIICVSTALGLVASTLAAVFTLRSDAFPGFVLIGKWLDFAAWVLLATQAVCIVSEPHYRKRYDIAVRYGTVSFVFLAKSLIELKLSYATLQEAPDKEFRYQLAAISSQCVISVIQQLAAFLIPRRPDVYFNGRLVDRQFTVSFIGKYCFTWPTFLLDLARKRRLEKPDLPTLDHWMRCDRIVPGFRLSERRGSLFAHIVRVHINGFAMQYGYALVQCILQIMPHLLLLQILRTLEKRSTSEEDKDMDVHAWTLVFGLGLAQVLNVINDSRLFWTMWSKVAIPMRSQLQALIFEKAMKRKDCKESNKEEEKDEKKDDKSSKKQQKKKDDKTAAKPAKKGLGGEEGKAASQQDTINLVAVDTFRVSNMGAWNYLLPASIGKVIICLVFLWKLIGWESLVVGMVTNLIFTPLNWYMAKRYREKQARLMKVRDKKMAVVTEVLQGIRQIKFSALENQWEERIKNVREEELVELWATFIADSVMLFCIISGPIFLAAAALSTYALVHGELSPSVAFTSLGVFQYMEMQFGFIPDLITDVLDAMISVKRIEKYFDAPEKVENITPSDSISIEAATIGWPSDDNPDSEVDRFLLRDVNLKFPDQELSVISGKTGSGKSLLLASLIGEVDLLKGKINLPMRMLLSERYDSEANAENWIIPSAVAFVSQIPFIENASIKENITFGLPFDQSRYEKVLKACSLVKDLEMFTDGDATEVGAQGISLSGGQRWRLTFARALYSRAGILILDDLFSALDAHVGREIFLNGLTGELAKGRTRILVTHHVALCLSRTKYLVMLQNGEVEYAAPVEELQSTGVIGEILKEEEKEVHAQEQVEEAEELAKKVDDAQPDSSTENSQPQANGKAAPKKFVEEEQREVGGVKLEMYTTYIRNSGGAFFWLMVLIGYILQQALTLGRSWWVKLWTASYTGSEQSVSDYAHSYTYQTHFGLPSFNNNTISVTTAASGEKRSVMFYISIYAAISVAAAIMGSARSILLFIGSIRASRNLFYKLTHRVLRMPLRWVDTVPLGRILNRFTYDFNVLDTKLAQDLRMWSWHLFNLFGMIVAGLFVSPYVIFMSVVITSICIRVGQHFLDGARDVKRLESVAKSPIFEQFGSALKGLSTIRAFDKSDVFNKRMCDKVDTHAIAYWHLWLMNRWVGYRLSVIGCFFATGIAAAVVSIRSIDAALAGFALSFSLTFTQSMQASIRQYANMELDMNSLERVVEYSNLATEDQGGADVPAAWPTEGRIVVKDLVAGYAPELPPILKGLSFTAESTKRIGVVGRTGAGKSTLTLALFRFLESREGSISIDGIDISKIRLHDLRSRMAIIPQDPVLFSGTVRSNLDPFGKFEDEELMRILQRVHLVELKSEVSNLLAEVAESGPSSSSSSITGTSRTESVEKNKNIFEDLSSPISDGGHNLSQGQRQLLCLARAIISRPKIMVLDEATSAVDMVTDALIQRSIREGFTDSTVLCIAHRLVTVADFDQILVMSDGKAAEFGSPRELMELKGIFYGMVGQSGDKEKLEEMILGIRE